MLHLLGLSAATVPTGPYSSTTRHFTVKTLDASNQVVDVTFPTGAAAVGKQFPLISYTHGLSDHGEASYPKLFRDLASWGYVIAATNSCQEGCFHDCKTLPDDPPCFGNYYNESFKVLEWARSSAAASLPINNTAGVAVAGHSMGGQAALLAAADATARTEYGIKAAVMHHAYTHTYPSISEVPFLACTGTADATAPPAMAEKFFSAASVSRKGLINVRGANHHEPTTDYRPELALFTAAWIKLYVDGVEASEGMSWRGLIYGTGTDSVCGGGDGQMAECTMLPKASEPKATPTPKPTPTAVDESFYPDEARLIASPSPSPSPAEEPPQRAAVRWTI